MRFVEKPRNMHKILNGRRERQRPLGKLKHRCEQNICIFNKQGVEGVNWVRLVQGVVQKLTLLK